MFSVVQCILTNQGETEANYEGFKQRTNKFSMFLCFFNEGENHEIYLQK